MAEQLFFWSLFPYLDLNSTVQKGFLESQWKAIEHAEHVECLGLELLKLMLALVQEFVKIEPLFNSFLDSNFEPSAFG